MTDSYEISMPFARLSNWIDSYKSMPDPQWTDHRVMKVGEESGEVINALHNWRGGNPRKLNTHTEADVIKELLDTASAALCAVEHMTGNQCMSVSMLMVNISTTLIRVNIGLDE